MKKSSFLILIFSLLSFTGKFSCYVFAENGHALWLRWNQNLTPVKVIKGKGLKNSPTIKIAVDEISKFWNGKEKVTLQLSQIPVSDEGFSIMRNSDEIVISAKTDKGFLYGVYELLRMQTTASLPDVGKQINDSPHYAYRILNHWDNLNGTMERGFSGKSIFSRDGHFVVNETILKEYARANATIGINGAVVNNVNASPNVLLKENIETLSKIANILRPYGVKVYLSVNFASPMVLDSLKDADPLNLEVQEWWKNKVAQIYKQIPDFGGFLVKANSEGQPGPMDYKRTHVDGANMLARALEPFGGIVMWRAFVYAANSPDRANQAYEEFMPLDGQFMNNVILQVKNGPIDFQPREPVSSLFFNIKKTNIMPEFQITQEYTGECIHTCFLASTWNEFYTELGEYDHTSGLAGVANIGTDENWCGSDMAQSNWYAFGRIAWNPAYAPKDLASEWLKQTYTTEPAFVEPMTQLLCESNEAVVSYMMPLGLHHIFAGNHHYGPEPWYYIPGQREDWMPRYYHKADSVGLGFDRTKSGSNNVSQYPEKIASRFNDITTCPEKYLLFFHHVGWTDRLQSGNILWNTLCDKYESGIKSAEGFVSVWNQMKKYVDSERYEFQLKFFERQAKDAWWWRDACLLYFQQFSHLPFPVGSPQPRHSLDELRKFRLRMDNYTRADISKLP